MVRYVGDETVAHTVRQEHPEVVGEGRVQAWVVGSGGGDRAGEELDAFCARRIYQPLGMAATHFNRLPFAGERARYAATEQCSWRDRVLWGEVHDPNAWAMGGVAGHAGLFGTAPDVLQAVAVAHRLVVER